MLPGVREVRPIIILIVCLLRLSMGSSCYSQTVPLAAHYHLHFRLS